MSFYLSLAFEETWTGSSLVPSSTWALRHSVGIPSMSRFPSNLFISISSDDQPSWFAWDQVGSGMWDFQGESQEVPGKRGHPLLHKRD